MVQNVLKGLTSHKSSFASKEFSLLHQTVFPCERVEVWAQDYLIVLVWMNQDFFSQLLTAVKEDIKSLYYLWLQFSLKIYYHCIIHVVKMHAK